MKVKDLIKKLQELDSDKLTYVWRVLWIIKIWIILGVKKIIVVMNVSVLKVIRQAKMNFYAASIVLIMLFVAKNVLKTNNE